MDGPFGAWHYPSHSEDAQRKYQTGSSVFGMSLPDAPNTCKENRMMYKIYEARYPADVRLAAFLLSKLDELTWYLMVEVRYIKGSP